MSGFNADKLQKIDRRWLYVILIVSVAITLLVGKGTEIPVYPDDSSKDLYITLMNVPEDKPVFIQSDWTNSTRGESRGQMMALLRVLMSNNRKFVIYSMGDPQAPQVARDAIRMVNEERRKEGLDDFKSWEDYIELGNFPNAENSLNALGNNIRSAWGNRRRPDTTGVDRSVFESPVLANVQKVSDCGAYVVVTASSTIDFAVERISDKVNLNAMVTGVVGPTVLPYKRAGQVKGLAIGLKGVYDMEYMMKYGLNHQLEGGVIKVDYPQKPEVSLPPVPNGQTFGQGATNYLSLHIALGLMILAIILGNVGMFVGRKGGKK
ncbi:MAG: hypothetical protein KF812_07505 [Fimbriimonadaceae bacterium]|nr:hypothetical protein [Fimbriimonadaceae bacterium]